MLWYEDNGATVRGEWRVESCCWMIRKLCSKDKNWRRGRMIFPTRLLHHPVCALRGHAARANRALLSLASGHFSVLQPVCSGSRTSANRPWLIIWAFSALHSSPASLSALFLSSAVYSCSGGSLNVVKDSSLNSIAFQSKFWNKTLIYLGIDMWYTPIHWNRMHKKIAAFKCCFSE